MLLDTLTSYWSMSPAMVALLDPILIIRDVSLICSLPTHKVTNNNKAWYPSQGQSLLDFSGLLVYLYIYIYIYMYIHNTQKIAKTWSQLWTFIFNLVIQGGCIGASYHRSEPLVLFGLTGIDPAPLLVLLHDAAFQQGSVSTFDKGDHGR